MLLLGSASAWLRGSSNKKDEVIHADVKNKIDTIDFSQFVIMYRTNAQSRALEETFLKYGVPYRIVGGIKFYQRREIKDMISYLRVLTVTIFSKIK